MAEFLTNKGKLYNLYSHNARNVCSFYFNVSIIKKRAQKLASNPAVPVRICLHLLKSDIRRDEKEYDCHVFLYNWSIQSQKAVPTPWRSGHHMIRTGKMIWLRAFSSSWISSSLN